MNNSAYYEKFKGFQFSAPVTNPDGTRGLATSNAEGASLGSGNRDRAKITPDDRVQLTAAYTNATLKHLIGGSNDMRCQLARGRHQHLPRRDGQYHAALAEVQRAADTSTVSRWPTAR
jgi:hypothetical protein